MRRMTCSVLMVLLAAAYGGGGRQSSSVSLSPGCVGCPYSETSPLLAKQDPKNKFGWYNLGVIAQSSGDANGAAADFVKAIAIDPRFAWVRSSNTQSCATRPRIARLRSPTCGALSPSIPRIPTYSGVSVLR